MRIFKHLKKRADTTCGAVKAVVTGKEFLPFQRHKSKIKNFLEKRRIFESNGVYLLNGFYKGGDAMAIRERTELLEEQIFCHLLPLWQSRQKGRQRPEQECDIRTAFQRDRDRIIHSKSFRRLKHKTQVFLSPKGTIIVHV